MSETGTLSRLTQPLEALKRASNALILAVITVIFISGLPPYAAYAAPLQVAGNCNAIFVKSQAGDVSLNCGVGDKQLQRIVQLLNMIAKDRRSSSLNVGQLIDQMNGIFLDNSKSFDQIIKNTASLNEKSDKILQLIQSLVNHPDQVNAVLSKISTNALSYSRTSGPLTVQVVGAFYTRGYSPARIRLILRLTAAPSYLFDVGAVVDYKVGDQSILRNWLIVSDYGTSCNVTADDPGMIIPTAGALGYIAKYDASRRLTSDQLPVTVVTSAVCPFLVTSSPIDLAVRIYYRDRGLPNLKEIDQASGQWQAADFRFGGITPSSYGYEK